MKRLIAIQQALKVAKSQNATVITKSGGKYSYNYRDAEQILEAVKPILAEQKCAIICRAEYVTIDNQVYKRVRATLYGEDGKEIAFADDMVKTPGSADQMTAQQMSGCDTTYCKRYALQNLFAIDNSDDDFDSNNNPLSYQNRQVKEQPKAKAQPQQAKPQAQPQAQPQEKPQGEQKKGLIASAQNAVELNAVKAQLDKAFAEGRMTTQQHHTYEVQMVQRGSELNCTYTAEEGWVSNSDLFAE